MGTGRKSQVEKFNKKWGKYMGESRSLGEQNLKRNLEAPEVSHENLTQGTTLREAAAVFSSDGIQLFAKTFSNSVDNAVNKVLDSKMKSIEEMVGRVVEDKLLELLSGLSQGLNQSSSLHNITETVAEAVTKTVEQVITNENGRIAIKANNQWAKRIQPDVSAFIKSVGECKMQDISEMLRGKGYDLPSNTTHLMNAVIKCDPNIEYCGYGHYIYLDKSAWKTI